MSHDCRSCVHCVAVHEGEGIDCDDGGDIGTVSWPMAIAAEGGECCGYDPGPADVYGSPPGAEALPVLPITEPGGCGDRCCGDMSCPDYHPDGHGADNLAAGTKDTNPKDAIGSTKLPLDLVPPLTIAYASLAHLNGALKYGKGNWRKAGVRASIYAAAAKRHIDSWLDGEEVDPDDGVPHLSAVLACIGIILDSRACGKLTDDRMLPNPGYRAEVAQLTAHVKRLQALHADKKPRHFTIGDAK